MEDFLKAFLSLLQGQESENCLTISEETGLIELFDVEKSSEVMHKYGFRIKNFRTNFGLYAARWGFLVFANGKSPKGNPKIKMSHYCLGKKELLKAKQNDVSSIVTDSFKKNRRRVPFPGFGVPASQAHFAQILLDMKSRRL